MTPASPYEEFGTLSLNVSSKVKTAMSKASLYAELYTGVETEITLVLCRYTSQYLSDQNIYHQTPFQ